jgi:hypothetical protein
MTYPTLEQVEAADKTQLCRWWRFLDSPGMNAIGESRNNTYLDALYREAAVMTRIGERIAEFGGWDPATSKAIGWE